MAPVAKQRSKKRESSKIRKLAKHCNQHRHLLPSVSLVMSSPPFHSCLFLGKTKSDERRDAKSIISPAMNKKIPHPQPQMSIPIHRRKCQSEFFVEAALINWEMFDFFARPASSRNSRKVAFLRINSRQRKGKLHMRPVSFTCQSEARGPSSTKPTNPARRIHSCFAQAIRPGGKEL